MSRIRTLLLPAALLCAGWTAHAHAQVRTPRPHKRIEVVSQGMTPAQVRAVLGEPLRTRRDGTLTYLYYANGSAASGGDDYVVIQDCHVVGARFANPSRFVSRAPADTSTPPAAECYASAADSATAPPPVAMRADTQRTPPPPNDVSPGGAMPVDQPRLVAEDRPLPQMSSAEWRSKLRLRRPATHLVAVPAASISSPTGFGVDMGEAYVGVAYQQRTRFTDTDDATASIGVGLGDSERYAGLELSATSYSTLRGGGPFETGGLNVKLHRSFGNVWGVAVGYENAVSWGGSDAGHSPYATLTRVFRLQDDPARPFSAIAATVGAGAGRFRSEADIAANRETVNPFGAIGLQVAEPLSLTADWNGQDLFAAASLAPLRRVPLVINAGVADITGNAGDGARIILSAGLGFRWLPPFF